MHMFHLSCKTTALLLALIMLLAVFTPCTAPAHAIGEEDADSMSLQGERIYQIMVDRFYDGDPTNNATGEAFRYAEVTAEDFRYMHGGD